MPVMHNLQVNTSFFPPMNGKVIGKFEVYDPGGPRSEKQIEQYIMENYGVHNASDNHWYLLESLNVEKGNGLGVWMAEGFYKKDSF